MKPGSDPVSPELREGIALLAAYLLSSGRRLLEETPGYALYRLLEGARRALELLETAGEATPDLVAVRSQLDGVVFGPPADRDFATLLDNLCAGLVTALTQPDTAAEPAP
ncbi:DUF6092 family protein [Goodfellowiella coeruleoviolacea]|uniref:Uncharacterized protein n=1 Tax=Goodfellowiella coeruleoviolacea TaxID=334858 RepID=A0AAE3GHD2_9PSEU|nr:DUF6092 family protein [Goodfellowiella coeruleoviolacea]MCP2168190.1 hypothetical protein [Goodfellowiella coeruleoviolacea]